MTRLFRKFAVATAVLAVACQVSFATPPTPTKKKSDTTDETTPKREVIVLKEQGKADRKCVIVSTTPRTDGTVSHQVKALDNGEIMTIVEPKSSGTAVVPPAIKYTGPDPEAKKAVAAKPTISVKTDAVPSAMNPPKAKETVKATETKVAPMEMPKGAQMPVPTQKGSANVSEPAVMVEPAPLPVTRVPAMVPVANPAVQQAAMQTAQLKEMLREAMQPAHREMAAEGLCASGQSTNPEVRQMLLTAVKEDPAGSVRATCLRCLAKQNAVDEVLQTAMLTAQKDKDSRVRDEAKSIAQQMNRK